MYRRRLKGLEVEDLGVRLVVVYLDVVVFSILEIITVELIVVDHLAIVLVAEDLITVDLVALNLSVVDSITGELVVLALSAEDFIAVVDPTAEFPSVVNLVAVELVIVDLITVELAVVGPTASLHRPRNHSSRSRRRYPLRHPSLYYHSSPYSTRPQYPILS